MFRGLAIGIKRSLMVVCFFRAAIPLGLNQQIEGDGEKVKIFCIWDWA